jgi:flagellin-specific chaperone FliS
MNIEKRRVLRQLLHILSNLRSYTEADISSISEEKDRLYDFISNRLKEIRKEESKSK